MDSGGPGSSGPSDRFGDLLPAAARVLERAGVGLVLLDPETVVVWANRAFALGCGRPASELEGRPLGELVLSDDRAALEAAVRAAAAAGSTDEVPEGSSCRARVVGADGRVRALELELGASSSDLAPVLAVSRDVSEHRRRDRRDRQARVQQARAATVDPDTGMPNRRGLDLVLDSATRHSLRSGFPYAVLHCEVSTPPGAPVAELVAACAARISQRLRTADTVSRTAAEVLVVVAEDLGDEQDAAGVAYRVLSTVVEPVTVSGEEHRVDLVVGIAVGDGRSDVNELPTVAAEAAREARADGPGAFRLHDLRGTNP